MNRDINVSGDIYGEQFAEKEIKLQFCVMARKGGCPFDVNPKNCFQLLGFTSS